MKLWKATNPEARDFRVETLGKVWTRHDLGAREDGVYVVRLEKPAKGWTACLVELTYALKDCPHPFKFTTEVKVVPDILPYKFQPKKHPLPGGGN